MSYKKSTFGNSESGGSVGWADIIGKPSFKAIATSGNLSDVTNNNSLYGHNHNLLSLAGILLTNIQSNDFLMFNGTSTVNINLSLIDVGDLNNDDTYAILGHNHNILSLDGTLNLSDISNDNSLYGHNHNILSLDGTLGLSDVTNDNSLYGHNHNILSLEGTLSLPNLSDVADNCAPDNSDFLKAVGGEWTNQIM